MFKIIYVVSTLKRSGPTNQLLNLVKHLDRSQFEPHIITLSPEPKVSRWKEFENNNFEVETLGLSRVKGMLRAKNYLKKKFRISKPDVVHTQGIRADSLVGAINLKCPWLLTSRNYPCHDYKLKYGKLKGCLLAVKHLSTMKKCEHVIACSKSNAALLSNHGIKAKIIQNGVDTTIYSPVDVNKKHNLRHRLKLESTARIIVSVGSLIARKDMALLIKAVLNIDSRQSVQLLIIGAGPLDNALKKLSGNSRNIIFTGQVSNVIDYLNCADLFVSSSLSEGLPNTVLEAMACGLACILSDIPSHRELFENHNQVLFFTPGDKLILSNLLESYLRTDMTKYGLLSHKIIKSNFSAKQVSSKYQKLYTSLLSKDFC